MQKRRNKTTEKSRVFYKMYLVNIIITMVFICLISMVCSTLSSRLILDNFIKYNEDMIAEKRNVMDERIRQLEETCNLITSEGAAFRFIMTNDPEYEKPTKLLQIIRYFQNICSENRLIEGICLVDFSRKIALDEKTKTPIEEQEEYQKYQGQNSFFLTEKDGSQCLEFVKRLEPIRGEKLVYIILAVNQDSFLSDLLVGGESSMVESCLFTKEGRSLSVNGSDNMDSDVRNQLMELTQGVMKYEGRSRKTILYKNPSEISDIAIAAVQDYTYLEKQTMSVKKVVILVSVLMITAASVIIYVCSLYMYHPLKRLGCRIQRMNERTEEKPRDEFWLLEHMIDTFQSEKEYTQPLVIRDSIQKLVRESFDQERFDYLKETFHQKMEFPWYVLIVTECRGEADKRETGYEFLKQLSKESGVDGFFTDVINGRSIGIFNTSLEYEGFIKTAETLKTGLEKDSSPFLCCISRGFQNKESMNLVYSETLNSVEKAIFIGKLTLVYGQGPLEQERKEQYKKEEENKLIRFVSEGKDLEAREVLGLMTKGFCNEAGDIQYTRFLYFQICKKLVKNSMELGAKLPTAYVEKELFQKIFKLETIQELEQFSENILCSCIESFQKKEKGYSSNVEKAIEFIKSNYMRELSIEDVASSVFLSSGYLSIIFKEETGYTILEYITHIRMQKAGELLRNHMDWKVKEVAEQLGYHNVQSFIRFFKKYYGETPVTYRKKDEV